MKTQRKEISEVATNYSSFDKLEFAGASMFGVIKNRKTRMLSYEQVFMLDSHIQILHKPIILKETKLKTRSSQTAPQKIASFTTMYSSEINNTIDIIKPKVSESIPFIPDFLPAVISHIEIKKERKMLSFKELLN